MRGNQQYQPQIIAGRIAMGAGPFPQGTVDDQGWTFRRTATGTAIVTLPWVPVAVTAVTNSQGRAVSVTITPGSREVVLVAFITSTLAADDQSIFFTAVGPPA